MKKLSKLIDLMKYILFIYVVVAFPSVSKGQIVRSPWPDPSANEVIPYYNSGLTHGPMLGHTTKNSMRVWVRTTKPMEFKVVYDTKLPLNIKSRGIIGRTIAENDNTGFVNLTDLMPDTRYYYGVVIDNKLIDTRMNFTPGFPFFVTLPDRNSYIDPKYNPDGKFNFSFGVGFGNKQGKSYRYIDNPAYLHMLKNFPYMRFFIMNGDYIYESARNKDNLPYHTAIFRTDYKIYLERGRNMARFFRYIPTLFLYDDHETFSDLEGTGEIGLKRGKWLYRDIALKPWYEYAGWSNFHGPQFEGIRYGHAAVKKGGNVLYDKNANFSTLREEAISTIHIQMDNKNAGVYDFEKVIDMHHIKVTPAFTQSETCNYSIGTHHYYDWKVGNCHFFVLDTRGERTKYMPDKVKDPDRFILGKKQSEWLMDGINNSDAEFIFVISTVSWMIYHTNYHMYTCGMQKGEPKIVNGRSVKEDGFTGAVYERDKLLRFFDKLNKPVIILTGDLHNSCVVQISNNIWEIMIGPLGSADHPFATAGNPPSGGWFDSEGWPVKIKWIAGFPNKVCYYRLRNNYYGVINVNNVMKSARQNEVGLHWIAYNEPQIVVQIYDCFTGNLVYAEGISTVDSKPKRIIKEPSVR